MKPAGASAGLAGRIAVGMSGLFPVAVRRRLEHAGLAEATVPTGGVGFDLAHYEASAGRRFASREAALLHYVLVGSASGFEPCAGFSPRDYRHCNPDVAAMGYEAFAHYLRFGRYEGRSAPAGAGRPDGGALAAPDLGRMLERPAAAAAPPRVDVIVPVYGNRSLALRTIDSVLAARTTAPFELVVIDDASPDRVLREELGLLAQRRLVTLIANDRNRGFVQSANRGMRLHPGRDVVLLNSDTCVFDGWLDRLLEALHGAPRTATASPLSNAATILSYPVTLRDNPVAPDGQFASWDRLCRGLGQADVEIPTAVGFCMAIRRACLDQVGPFDADRFGRGYGEENDFSLRAAAAGWRHVAAAQVMVWHRSGGSFGAERDRLIAAAQDTIERLHPGYRATVRQFIRRDPLQPVRMAIDMARVAADPRPKVLKVGCRREPAGSDAGEGVVLRLVPDIGPYFGRFRLLAPDFGPLPNLPRLDGGAGPEAWSDLLDRLAVDRVEWGAGTPPRQLVVSLSEAASRLGIEVR